jgi:7-cyano-7-deazaguanine synthase
MSSNSSALVVLSGGQDSTTCLFWAKQHFKTVHAISFYYGQRHARELACAKAVAALAGVGSMEIVDLTSSILKSTSPLTSGSALETYTDFKSMDSVIGDRVELTFVPMRNALFLTIAANRAVALGTKTIVTGVCQADNANYPDCRVDFVNAQEKAIREALGVDDWLIATPLMQLSKKESVLLSRKLDSPAFAALAFTHTAYSGEYPPVTQDHATVLRAHGFEEAGLPDPLILRANMESCGRFPLPKTDNYSDYDLNVSLMREIYHARIQICDSGLFDFQV